MKNYVVGKNPVIEALRSERRVEKVLASGEGGANGKITALAKQRGIPVQNVPKSRLDELSASNNHQGVLAVIAPVEYAELGDVFSNAESKDEPPFIVVLDHIEDPHNLGAIIRSAEAAGAHGVIIPKNRAAGVTAVVEKASAGAVSHIPIVRVANIPQAVETLKERGVWVYCAAQDGECLFNADLSGAIAVVIGSEGGGVSQLTKKKCDVTVSIPMRGKIGSLNASVAAGIVLYEIVRQRGSVK